MNRVRKSVAIILAMILVFLTAYENGSTTVTYADENVSDRGLMQQNMSVKVEETLKSMTLKEKVCQLFVVVPEAVSGDKITTVVNNNFRDGLEKYPVGGIIYFGANILNPDQTKAMLATTMNYSMLVEGLPLFQCVDEEGGIVTRIAGNSRFGLKNVGKMAAITSEDAAFNAGNYIGQYLKNLGFNTDFAPDADVLTNGENSIIGSRSFGSNPIIVTELCKKYSEGLHNNGILSTYKHFPGHGATKDDSHKGYVYTNKSYEELSKAELVPFMNADDADFIMVGHISLPKVLESEEPATFSYYMITELLKKTYGYKGLVVTDALNMGAITKYNNSAESAVKAFLAGNDILLMPVNLEEAVDGMIQAVESGIITEERLDESVRKIIQVKQEKLLTSQ